MEMSDEARFGFQDLDVDNNDLVLSVNDQFLNKKGGIDKKDFIKKLNIGQPNQQAAISSERHAAASSTKCPSHPEEDFQFYCFNKDQLLCPECLVSGKYAGYEISNLKKAAEKLKGKFNSVIVEAIGKFQAYSQIEEEVEGYEEEIERAASTYEEVIVKQMDEIRQKINNKEQEMLQNILSVRQERLNELKSSTKWLQNYREEIESVKETGSDELSSLDDLQVCKYYSKKATVMKSFLQNDNSFKTQAIKENVEAYQVQDQSNLSKFLEDCKGLKLSLDSIKGPETGRARQNTGNSTKETFRASGASYFLASSETITNNIRKDSREVSLPFNTLPNKLVIPPKATFLPKQGNEEIIELNSLLKSPTNKVFEKHLAKVHEIRKPTPKKDAVSETRFTPKESKRSEAVNSLMIEMRRGNSSKRTNVSGISFHNDTSSILDTYKEILTKRTTGIDSKTPKTYMISINNPTPTKPFNSALSSPNNIIQASSSIYSNVSPKESRERNSKIARNNYEIFASEINRSSIKTFLKESDSVHNLNFDKMLMRRKANERNGTVSSSDIGLKKKLNQLSNELFK